MTKSKKVYVLYIDAEVSGNEGNDEGYEQLGMFSTRKKALKELKIIIEEHPEAKRKDFKIEIEIIN